MIRSAVVALSLFCVVGVAEAGLIDFESFNVGDSLATVNTAVAGMGASFDAIFPATFQVVTDPGNAANQGLRSQTLTSFADILINFTSPQDFVRVDFLDNPDGGPFFTLVIAYDHTGTPTIQGSGGVIDSDSGFEPNTLFVSGAGIRAVQFESGSGFVYIDNIEWGREQVPEPAALAMLAAGALLLLPRRRRRSA